MGGEGKDVGEGGEAPGRFVCLEELGKHFLVSPLPAPFIKPISILKAVRNPSVLRLVSYLTQCFPHSSTLPCLTPLREPIQPQRAPWDTLV